MNLMDISLLNKQSLVVRILYKIRIKSHNTKLCRWLEKKIASKSGGVVYNKFIREFYKEHHGLTIGYGTYGGCWNNSVLWWRNISIGNYCSFAQNITIIPGNHCIDWFSTHPCLAESEFGSILYKGYPTSGTKSGTIIMNDVWVGTNVTIMPGCKKIGNGAIIGGGSVVTHDVPPYAIVAGNPAKILRYRFDEDIIKKLEESKWWELELDELKKIAPQLQEIVGVKISI